MRWYNTVPLILLILSIINFALAAPALMPENKTVRVDVVHVPKDGITVLGKRGDELEKVAKLFDNFDRWWGNDYLDLDAESSSAVLPPSSSESAPLESGHASGSMQVQVPPANPASSTESDRNPESSMSHPPTPSTASSSESNPEDVSTPSLESVSDPHREEINVDHDPSPPDPELIGSEHESEHRDAPPSSLGSDSDSA